MSCGPVDQLIQRKEEEGGARPSNSLSLRRRTDEESWKGGENLGRDPGFDRRLLLLLKGRAEGENEEEENLLK